MNTADDLSYTGHDATKSNENFLDASSLFEIQDNEEIPIKRYPVDTNRNFRASLYGLPLKPCKSPNSSSSSLLLYQLYALNVLRDQPNDAIQSSQISNQINTSLSIHQNHNTTEQVENEQNPACLHKYRSKFTCLLILIIIFFTITLLFFIITSNFGMRLAPCNCPAGYERSLSASLCTCIDRNECLSGTGYHTCSGINMQCINTMGSYVCRCRAGYTNENDQMSCVDINECDLYKPCNSSISTCVNVPGRYFCQCLSGHIGDDQCIPKNICTEKNHLCGPHSECVVSSANEYNCQCLPGHRKYEDGQCSKINECELKPSICEHGRSCILTRDRFDCCTSNVTKNDTGECLECGLPVNRRQARIVNGDRSYRGQWPWMAVVGVYFRDDTNHWINITQKCAATLIANRYLLTAAHCLSNQLPTFDTMRLPNRYQSSLKDTYRVSFDVIDIENDIIQSHAKSNNENILSRTYTLEHACIHPGFDHNTLLHDIAILKLKQPIVRSSLIDTICLPDNQDLVTNGTRVWVAGWGSNAEHSASLNKLMHADLQILPPSLCPSIGSTDYQLCAGWPDGKKDACRGDSGGPLMLYTDHRWFIIGIVSFGDGCSRVNSGGVYTRVSAYNEWILQIMSSTTNSLNCSASYDYAQILTEISTMK